MLYVVLGIFVVLVFALCFAVDHLIQRLRARQGRSGVRSVRPPRRSVTVGIVLLILGLLCLLFWEHQLATFGGIIIALMGLVMLTFYFVFSLEYDERGFTCRNGRTRIHYHYNQIRGQQTLQTRSGLAVAMQVGDDLVELNSAMTGAQEFLAFAYSRWCTERGVDPDTCPPPNPRSMVWFPPLEESKP